MSQDWYDEGMTKLRDELTEVAGTYEAGAAVYAFLHEIGMIDYNIEKEIIWERYVEAEEVDEDDG